MKNYIILGLIILFIPFFFSCQQNKGLKSEDAAQYSVTIEPLTDLDTPPPALQSFIHGVEGNDWLLFGGRTNSPNSNEGGLHQIDIDDYAYESFPCRSFNTYMYAYDINSSTIDSVNIVSLINELSQLFNEEIPFQAFVNSNSQVKQDGDDLYILGGYGPINSEQCYPTSQKFTVEYATSPYFMKLDVSFWIEALQNNKGSGLAKFIAGEFNKVLAECKSDYTCLLNNLPILFGQSDYLAGTGGELFKKDDTFYLAVGQNYFETDKFNDGKETVDTFAHTPYLTSIRAFQISATLSNNVPELSINTSFNPISDVDSSYFGTQYADENSTFRRRDVSITPSFFGDIANFGFTIHGGVFQPGGPPFHGWNDALFIYPDKINGIAYSHSDDSAAYGNFNLYACANFTGYDEDSESIHTFLMGGIGDGQTSSFLSGFTKSVTHVTQPLTDFAQSISIEVDEDGFAIPGYNFYGAESVFVFNDDIGLTFMDENPDILDLNNLSFDTNGQIEIGYIYGGIEADISNPGGYQGDKSRASNKIFTVTLTKN